MKKLYIIVFVILSVFLISCSRKNTDIYIEVINNSNNTIEGNFYESNQKIGEDINLEVNKAQEFRFTKKELVDSFNSREYETGSLMIILNDKNNTKIILTGYITNSYNDLSGRYTSVRISNDSNYNITSKDL